MNLIIKNTRLKSKHLFPIRKFAKFNFEKEAIDDFPWRFNNKQELLESNQYTDFLTLSTLN